MKWKTTEITKVRATFSPEITLHLLIDHQVGLMQFVRDMLPEEFRNNV
jgi:hypothetical protein